MGFVAVFPVVPLIFYEYENVVVISGEFNQFYKIFSPFSNPRFYRERN